uniref:Limbin n=1 Tax=Pavo cristatus TaxID=9049 RepID=A0A8C9FTY4_PAVCR
KVVIWLCLSKGYSNSGFLLLLAQQELGFQLPLFCLFVDVEHDPQTAYIRLLINNTNSPLSRNITDLILLDNVTGLHVQNDSGNETRDGMQIYRKRFLQVGEYFAINYTALLDGKKTWNGRVLTLPAQLTFRNLVSLTTFHLKVIYYVTYSCNLRVFSFHAIHASGFFIAFFVSLVLMCAVFFIFYRTQLLRWSFYSKNQNCWHQSHKLEHSQFNSGDLFSEDVIMNDQIIDILTSEESGNMLRALEDLEVASLTRADADLEAYRMQICKEVIAMMMKNMVLSHSLIPHVEKRMSSTFKKQFLTMEREFQEEYERKVVALTAECNLETRKKMEAQRQKERAANEEAEELMKKGNEMPAVECRSLLDRLHSLEQDHLKRFLLVKQEEYFAKAYRQLAVSQRKELHNIFFTQITSAICKGELKLEIAKSLVEDYSKIQVIGQLFFPAHSVHRDYFVACSDTCRCMSSRWGGESCGIWTPHVECGNCNQAKTLHSTSLILACILRILLRIRMQHCEQILIKQNETREHQKEQLSVGNPFKTSKEITDYLSHWKTLLSDHATEFEELTEKLDNEGCEELRDLLFNLTEKTVEELKLVQYGVFVQELVKLSVPKTFLLEVVEEHKKEIIFKHEHLEREEREKSAAAEELLQLTRQRLSQELENSLSQQKKLRSWEQSVFMQVSLSFLLSQDSEVYFLDVLYSGRFQRASAIEELDRKLEYEMLRKESAQQQQHLMNKQRWTPDGLRPLSEAVETNVDRQVTFLLRQAMSKCMQFINLHQQRVSLTSSRAVTLCSNSERVLDVD